MAIKTLIFLGLVVAAMGFTLPEQQTEEVENRPYYVNPGWIDLERNGPYYDMLLQEPVTDDEVLVRRARSPQGSLTGRFAHSGRAGSSATFDYTHPINKNWEAYAQGSRNFKYHDTNVHGGLRFKF